MTPRALNIICLIMLIGGAIWSGFLWYNGDIAKATLVAVLALLWPTALRALCTL